VIVQTALRVDWVKLKLVNVTRPVELALTVWEFVPHPLTVAVTGTTVAPGA
jgi:hypothetical protein